MNHASFNPAQQATAHNDHLAYGSLFQWGRYSDGHELVNLTGPSSGTHLSGTTLNKSSTDLVGHNMFIAINTTTRDWRNPANDNLWQSEASITNPCPDTYRLPTITEMNTLVAAESITDYTAAANSALGFTAAGRKSWFDAAPYTLGSGGYYLTSTIAGTGVAIRFFYFDGTSIVTTNSYRQSGRSVRCIKD